jgi:hypothetical protein
MAFAVVGLIANLCLGAFFFVRNDAISRLGVCIAAVGVWASLILIALEASV